MTNTTNESPQLFAANELMGAALTANMSKSDRVAFASDSKSFISSSLNFDTGDISVSVVENDSATLNLALPYYSALENISADVLKDVDMDDVSGGEILISILAVTAGVAAGAVAAIAGASSVVAAGALIAGGIAGGVVGIGAVAAIGTAGAAQHKASKGQNLDGSKK